MEKELTLELLNRWRPNWKDWKQYPKTYEDLSPDGWAWEFLRRNENYQREFIGFYLYGEDYWRETDKYSEFMEEGFYLLHFLRHNGIQKYEDHSCPDPRDDQLNVQFMAEYNLRYAPGFKESPEDDFLDARYPEDSRSSPFPMEGRDPSKFCPRVHEVAFYFTLYDKLEPQLAKAKELLKGYQEKLDISPNTRNSGGTRSHFPLYLRLLDADYAGFIPGQIAGAIYGSEYEESDEPDSIRKRVLAQLTKAKKVCSGDYLKYVDSAKGVPSLIEIEGR